MSPDDSTTTSGAINLSIKPAGLDESEKDCGGGNIIDDHEHSTSPNPSILEDNEHNKETPDSVSDTPSENLLTGKPVVYHDIQEVINTANGVPGININSSNKSDTPLQSSSNASEKANSKQSITKSRNIAFKNSAESGTNISPKPKQKEISNEFDPYTDASLSGTLEQIYVDENIISIAAKGISHEIEYQDDSLIDHNYSNLSCSSASKSVTEPPPTQLTQLTNDPDEYQEVGCNHIYTELSQDTENYSAHDDVDNIETEIVSMECTETYITSTQGSSGYFHQAPGSIPGTNTPTNTVQNIQYTMDATVATLMEISISNSSGVVSGTNIASRQYNMMGINMNAVISADNTEPVDSDLQMSDNWQTDTIQGINNTNSSSRESSDFEGFTSADLKSFTTPSTYLTDGSSTILSPDNYSCNDAVEDSSDTIPATDPAEDTDNTRQKLNYLTSMNNNTNSILPDIINLWEKDAMNKKWTVPLCKLTPKDIYALSKPPPNSDTMNPYSSLDEVQGSANESQTEPLASTKPNMKQDQARNKSPQHRKLQRSSYTGKQVAYLEESTSNKNDSDYEPSPKPVRNINVGLKAPSSTRIHAQNII